MARSQPLATPPSRSASPPVRRAASPGRLVLTHDDLLWFMTSQDEEGRITLGVLPRTHRRAGRRQRGVARAVAHPQRGSRPAPNTRGLAGRIDPEDVVMTESARSIPREDVRELTGAAGR
jgi:hypothetical protein